MWFIFIFLFSVFGGTAFAQSAPTPAPHGAPAANRTGDRLQRVDETSAEALYEITRVRTELVAQAAELDARKREYRLLAARVTALEAEDRTTQDPPASPPSEPTTSTTPTVPPTAPSTGTLDERIEQVERWQGVLREILFGLDHANATEVGEALQRWGRTQSGLEAFVLEINGDIATIKRDTKKIELRLDRGFRAFVGVGGSADFGPRTAGVRAGVVSQGGINASLGHGFAGDLPTALDLLVAVEVGYATTSWSTGARASATVPGTPVELGGQVTVGQLSHGFAQATATGAYGIETRVTPAVYAGVRTDAGPTVGLTVGRGFGPSWTAVEDDVKVGTSSGTTIGLFGGWSF